MLNPHRHGNVVNDKPPGRGRIIHHHLEMRTRRVVVRLPRRWPSSSDGPDAVQTFNPLEYPLPLPGGEGRGEGELFLDLLLLPLEE